MDGIERSENSRKRLGGALEDRRHRIEENEALEKPKDSFSPPRQLVIREILFEADPVQGPQALYARQSACDRISRLVRSGKGTALPENRP